jgi:antitoxin FitA
VHTKERRTVDWSAAAKPTWTLEMRDINDYDEITFRHTDISTHRYPVFMASITIRNLESHVKERLRVRAARQGHSMEEEARTILRAALAGPADAQKNLFDRIHGRFAALGGAELAIPPREAGREPPSFEES